MFGKQPDVVDCARRASPRRPRQRHGGRLRPSATSSRRAARGPCQPPIHMPLAVVVLAARRRADAAQLRVDGRAVVALVVVLDDQLPVRRQLVVVGGADDEALGLVARRRAARCRRGTRRPAAPCPTALTKTQPCHSSTATGTRPCSATVEPGRRVEARRRQQRAVEPVAPAVVRAVDRAVLGSSTRTAAARGRGAGTRCRSRAARRRRRAPAGRRRRRPRTARRVPGVGEVGRPAGADPRRRRRGASRSQASTASSR